MTFPPHDDRSGIAPPMTSLRVAAYVSHSMSYFGNNIQESVQITPEESRTKIMEVISKALELIKETEKDA